MIFIGLGANLPTVAFGQPRATLGAALEMMVSDGLDMVNRSPWYESAPVPVSDQPWYVNGVCEIGTRLSANDLVTYLLELEKRFGRERSFQNAPRILDLDLIAYNDLVIMGDNPAQLSVPHPRMSQRAFVLLPLRDIAPNWQDPVAGKSIETLVKELPSGQQTKKMKDADGYQGTEWGEAN